MMAQGRWPSDGRPPFARHDGQGGIDLRRLQELAVSDGKVFGREEVGQKMHAVHAANPRFAEGRLEQQVQVPGETFAQVLQRPAAPVGERAPAFDRTRVGEEAHVPLDFSAVVGVGRQHLLGIAGALYPGHMPGLRRDPADAKGNGRPVCADIGELQLLAQDLKPVAHNSPPRL